MKKEEVSFMVVIAILLVGVIALGTWLGTRGNLPKQLGDAGAPLYYTSPTQATSSVGLYTPVNILANSGSRQYALICNTSPTTTNDLLLEFDATSSVIGLSAPAALVPGNSCYDMTLSKMFLGNLYGIFSTNTATVETLVK